VVLIAAVGYLLAALAYALRRQQATWLAAASSAVLFGALAARGLRAGHWPLTSHYEFALTFALGTALSALTADLAGGRQQHRERDAAVEATTLLLVATLLFYARLAIPFLRRAIQPLPPTLQSAWLPLHAGTASLAYGALALAGAAGLVWLVRPAPRTETEQLLTRAIAAGYPLLTLSLIFGMIWAQVAWGRYWGWDLKETWTLITWLIYSLYWHLHRRSGWRGRRLAWLALAGLGAVLFTFLGTGWLARIVGLESLHLF
jgi:ABC-type transport system involved in cytochrome c biogenesis permease subunit